MWHTTAGFLLAWPFELARTKRTLKCAVFSIAVTAYMAFRHIGVELTRLPLHSTVLVQPNV